MNGQHENKAPQRNSNSLDEFHWDGYLYSCLDKVQSESQGFPHEDVWVVGGLECFLQLLQLPAAVVGPCTTLLHWPLFIWKAKRKHQLHNRQRVTRN